MYVIHTQKIIESLISFIGPPLRFQLKQITSFNNSLTDFSSTALCHKTFLSQTNQLTENSKASLNQLAELRDEPLNS